jgi:hypothetical protein
MAFSISFEAQKANKSEPKSRYDKDQNGKVPD